MILGRGLAPPARAAARIVAPRSAARRYRRTTRVVRGALSLLLYVALAGGIATAIGSAAAYFKGRAAGYAAAEGRASSERADTERKHRAEVDKMRSDAAAATHQARMDVLAAEDALAGLARRKQQEIDHAYRQIRRLEGDAARNAADAARVRDELASAVARTCRAADAPGAAPDAGAGAIGGLLGGLLQEHRACALGAERDAAGLRSLREWADELPAAARQRAGEVAP